MMSRARAAPATYELLEALAANLETATAPEALAVIARAGPASARLARVVEERLRAGSLAAALAEAKLITRPEQALVAVGEEAARVPAALRCLVERGLVADERRRVVRNVVIAPLSLAAMSILAEQLPAMVLGGGSLGRAFITVALMAAATAALLIGLPRLWAHAIWGARLRAAAAKIPFARALARGDAEERAAAVVAAFADKGDLGRAPLAARAIVPAPFADALALAAANPFAPITTFSESFGLALATGARTGDLPARMAKLHHAAARATTARLRSIARVVAYAVVLIVFLHGAAQLLSTPLPGLGGDLGNSPEMRELEKELESAGH